VLRVPAPAAYALSAAVHAVVFLALSRVDAARLPRAETVAVEIVETAPPAPPAPREGPPGPPPPPPGGAPPPRGGGRLVRVDDLR
jgi:hypothetical protein